MTIGSESFGNGASKNDDRFSPTLGQYRPGSRRDAGETAARNGTSILDTRSGTLEPRGGSHDSRSTALDAALPAAPPIAPPKLPESAMRELNELADPVFPEEPWLDAQTGSLVDHPLLRGLLMELPPKGTMPPTDYLDRWFEAARSILDLLYTMNARR
jgi:hypothetical protein